MRGRTGLITYPPCLLVRVRGCGPWQSRNSGLSAGVLTGPSPCSRGGTGCCRYIIHRVWVFPKAVDEGETGTRLRHAEQGQEASPMNKNRTIVPVEGERDRQCDNGKFRHQRKDEAPRLHEGLRCTFPDLRLDQQTATRRLTHHGKPIRSQPLHDWARCYVPDWRTGLVSSTPHAPAKRSETTWHRL